MRWLTCEVMRWCKIVNSESDVVGMSCQCYTVIVGVIGHHVQCRQLTHDHLATVIVTWRSHHHRHIAVLLTSSASASSLAAAAAAAEKLRIKLQFNQLGQVFSSTVDWTTDPRYKNFLDRLLKVWSIRILFLCYHLHRHHLITWEIIPVETGPHTWIVYKSRSKWLQA